MNRTETDREPSALPRRTTSAAPDAPRVLLADDDLEMRKLMAWALNRAGYVLQECHDGASLKKWLDRAGSRSSNVAFDVVVSDIRMPGLTGLEVLADAQADGGEHPPMILVSAFCDAETQDRARRLGAAALLPKPFDVEELVARVRELAPTRGARDPLAAAPPPAPARAADEASEPDFPLTITFRHHDGNETLRRRLVDLAARLARHADHITRCRVVIDRLAAGAGHDVSVVVSAGSRPVVVEQTCGGGEPELVAAVRHAFDVAGRRLDERRSAH